MNPNIQRVSGLWMTCNILARANLAFASDKSILAAIINIGSGRYVSHFRGGISFWHLHKFGQTKFRLSLHFFDWFGTKCLLLHLVQNQSEKCNYNLNLVWFNKIQKEMSQSALSRKGSLWLNSINCPDSEFLSDPSEISWASHGKTDSKMKTDSYFSSLE